MRRLMVVLVLLLGGCATPSGSGHGPQALVDQAATTATAVKTDPSFGNAPALLARAKGVVIVPQLIKGGFMFGAEGGAGVMLARTRGGWSNPVFVSIGGGSFGLQIGVQAAEVVMFLMTNRAVDAILRNEIKFGVGAGLTFIVVGSAAEASTAANAPVDVVAWARSKGAYAGLTLAGSVITPHAKSMEAYYGTPLTAPQVLRDGAGVAKGATALKAALTAAEAPASARPSPVRKPQASQKRR
jgi:lipid-binding SYLF domain-containing protein